MTNHDRLFGATKIPFGGPPFGDTQNPREKLIPSHLEFYESRFALYLQMSYQSFNISADKFDILIN